MSPTPHRESGAGAGRGCERPLSRGVADWDYGSGPCLSASETLAWSLVSWAPGLMALPRTTVLRSPSPCSQCAWNPLSPTVPSSSRSNAGRGPLIVPAQASEPEPVGARLDRLLCGHGAIRQLLGPRHPHLQNGAQIPFLTSARSVIHSTNISGGSREPQHLCGHLGGGRRLSLGPRGDPGPGPGALHSLK